MYWVNSNLEIWIMKYKPKIFTHTCPNDGPFWIWGWNMEERYLGVPSREGKENNSECVRKRHFRGGGSKGRNSAHENTDQSFQNE